MTRMKTWGRVALMAALLGPLAACTESTGPDVTPDGAVIPHSQDMVLALGEEKAVDGSVIRISFGRVMEDSRCPVDELVQCVWEGRGVVEIGIRMGMGPTIPMTLSTQASGRTAVWNGVQVTLVAFEPAPSWNPPVPESAYKVKLRVENEGR